jgi:hypothetical protein
VFKKRPMAGTVCSSSRSRAAAAAAAAAHGEILLPCWDPAGDSRHPGYLPPVAGGWCCAAAAARAAASLGFGRGESVRPNCAAHGCVWGPCRGSSCTAGGVLCHGPGFLPNTHAVQPAARVLCLLLNLSAYGAHDTCTGVGMKAQHVLYCHVTSQGSSMPCLHAVAG